MRQPSNVRSAAMVVLGAWCLAMPQTRGEVDPAVLEAQQRRINVIRNASSTAVAIFAGEAGGGSGVLISPDGLALSNFHVTQPAGPGMRCGLADGRVYDAVLVGLDPTGDVALIKLLGRDDFPHAVLGDSDAVEPGDFCFAAGNPFLLATDLQPSISAGIVSGVHRYQFPAGTILEYADCLQVDAAINPGNSGGGLFDDSGRLIGVNGRASFEKRGRVNVGVGYAISTNQVRNFLGFLRGGRIADHATLGAVVASSADGKVVVSDILESSDAWRRGLRYDDEIVSLAGRPIRTVNAFKNVLGILPAGWQVPLAYRRGGRLARILVRLAGVHAPAELAAIVAGEGVEPQDRRPGDGAPAPQAAPEVPAAVRGMFEPRPGFANHHFNVIERDRVASRITARGHGRAPGPWRFSGRLASGAEVRVVLADDLATIDLPTGASRIDPRGELDRVPEPPGSGGLLAAFVLWRRLVQQGPAAVGRTAYWGTAAHDVASIGTIPAPPLVDVLETAVAGVEARFFVDDAGAVVGIDLWTAPDADPCEVRFTRLRADDGMPAVVEVRRGTEPFAIITVDAFDRGKGAP